MVIVALDVPNVPPGHESQFPEGGEKPGRSGVILGEIISPAQEFSGILYRDHVIRPHAGIKKMIAAVPAHRAGNGAGGGSPLRLYENK